jgi:hypothetical protein
MKFCSASSCDALLAVKFTDVSLAALEFNLVSCPSYACIMPNQAFVVNIGFENFRRLTVFVYRLVEKVARNWFNFRGQAQSSMYDKQTRLQLVFRSKLVNKLSTRAAGQLIGCNSCWHTSFVLHDSPFEHRARSTLTHSKF